MPSDSNSNPNSGKKKSVARSVPIQIVDTMGLVDVEHVVMLDNTSGQLTPHLFRLGHSFYELAPNLEHVICSVVTNTSADWNLCSSIKNKDSMESGELDMEAYTSSILETLGHDAMYQDLIQSQSQNQSKSKDEAKDDEAGPAESPQSPAFESNATTLESWIKGMDLDLDLDSHIIPKDWAKNTPDTALIYFQAQKGYKLKIWYQTLKQLDINISIRVPHALGTNKAQKINHQDIRKRWINLIHKNAEKFAIAILKSSDLP